MTDIVLVQPRSGSADKETVYPPLGLLRAAAEPVQKGRSVAIIDQRVNKRWEEELRKHLAGGAKVLCLTTDFGQQSKEMTRISHLACAINPDLLVVLIGRLAEVHPGLGLQDHNVEVVCYGETESLLLEMIDVKDGKKKFQDVSGLLFRAVDGARIIRTEEKPPLASLDELPPLPWHLIDIKKYPTVGLFSSRGKKYHQTISNVVTLKQRLWRGFSARSVLAEMELLKRIGGITTFEFVDTCFSSDIKRFKEIITILAKKGAYQWSASVNAADLKALDATTLSLLAQSGCRQLRFDVSSGSERLLSLFRFPCSSQYTKHVNKLLSKQHILLHYFFEVGYPTETREEVGHTLELMKQLARDNSNASTRLFFYAPFPYTVPYPLALEKGFAVKRSLVDWAEFKRERWHCKEGSWLTKEIKAYIENAVLISAVHSLPGSSRGLVSRVLSLRAKKFGKKQQVPDTLPEKFVAKVLANLNSSSQQELYSLMLPLREMARSSVL